MTSALRVLSAVFDIDTAKATASLAKLNTGITGAKNALGTAAASLVGAFSVGAISHFIGEQIELGSKLNDTAEKLGVTTEALQQFQYAAGLSGVGAEQAGTALQFLNKNLGEAIGGGQEQAKVFQELGVSLEDVKNGSKSAADLLPDIAKKFEEAGSDAERTALAMKIFGKQGAALIPLLKQGSGELANLRDEFNELGGGMQDDFIKMADKAGDEVDKLKFALTGLKSRIAVAILPSVTDFAKRLQHVAVTAIKLTKETHIVKEGLALLGVVGAAAGLKTALGWAKFFGIFPKGNAGILKTLASMGWIGVAIGLVAALALVFEDLFVGIEGGNSVIRKWLNETLGVQATNELFAQLGMLVENVKGSFQNMLPPLRSILQTAGAIVLSPAFIAGVEYAVRLFGTLLSLAVGVARVRYNLSAPGQLMGGGVSGALGALSDTHQQILGDNGFFGANAFKPYAPRAPSGSLGGAGGGAGTGPTDVSQTNTTNITINGAGDPVAVGRRVANFQRENAAQNAAALGALATGAGDDE